MRNSFSESGVRCVVAVGLAATLAIAPARAQQIDDIVVTARKKEESLQEVPLSITALSSEQIRERGITNNYDLALFTPNFNTVKQVGRTLDRPTIRGMANPSSRGEANASYFIDGVFVSSSVATATTDVVERVEVLRGPQSAQFGRATFSGAVNYVTRRPTNEWEGQVSTKAGTDDDYKVTGWVSGPLIHDRLAFLVSGGYEEYGGEWQNNLQPGTARRPADQENILPFIDPPQEGDNSDLGGETTRDFLLKLTWTPTDATLINLKWGYTEGDDDHFPSLVPPGKFPLNCFLPEPGTPWEATSGGAYCGKFEAAGWEDRINLPDFYKGIEVRDIGTTRTREERTAAPGKPGTRRETDRYLLDITQVIGDWEISGRAAYNDDYFNQVFDLDHTELRPVWGLFHFNQIAKQDDYSFELRVATPTENRFRASAGAYYFKTERNNRIRSYTGPAVAFGAIDPISGKVTTADYPAPVTTETENVALFGSFDVDLTERLTLALEGRWADDTKSIEGGNGFIPPDESTKAFTPRVTLRLQATDDLMVYGLVAKGNKPADFNGEFVRSDVLPVDDPGFTDACRQQYDDLFVVEEEEQWTYELGLKTAWLDRRLTANASAFYIDWDNQGLFTVLQFDCTTSGSPLTSTILTNAGQSRIYGLEFESNYVFNENLFLIANYGYQKGEFREGSDSLLADTTGDGDLKGKTIPSAPQHSVVLGMVATTQIDADMQGFIRADFVYESRRWNQAANLNWIGARQLLNLRLGVERASWTLTGYVNNLLDDDTPLSTLNFVDFDTVQPNGQNGELWTLNPQRGRNYGVEFQFRFGAI